MRSYYKHGNKNQRYSRFYNMKRNFGLTKEAFFNLLEGQDNKCALCNAPFIGLTNNLHIDHCHETNKIRGLLCMKCNVGLGMLGDNEKGLLRALEYVRGKLNG
jgi:hypothetical protein